MVFNRLLHFNRILMGVWGKTGGWGGEMDGEEMNWIPFNTVEYYFGSVYD